MSFGKKITIGLIVFMLSYTAYETSGMVRGPRLKLETPENGSTIPSHSVTIRGKAENVNSLKLNGSDIFTDVQGNFEKEVLLSSGYNVIELDAQDKFGKHITRKLELVSSTPLTTPVAVTAPAVKNY